MKSQPIRYRGPRTDLTDKRFGRLTVKAWAGDSRWVCACDCGKTTKVSTSNLNRVNTTSCGCIRNISSSKRATTHGLSKTHAYRTWLGVRRRCLDVNYSSYPEYGGRGIGMDDEWASDPITFIKDVGQPPSANYTLDRIDNAEGYYPGNVRWATPVEQANNKRNNRWVTYQGNRYTISQLARYVAGECGITHKQFLRAFEKELYNVNAESVYD